MTSKKTLYIAMSLDGYVADAHGKVDWLDPYMSETYGYEAFFNSVTAILMGRITFEQVRSFGEWPYQQTPCYVLTSRPMIPNLDLPVTAIESLKEIDALPESELQHLWILGGAQLSRTCMEANLIDEIDLFIMPTLLGQGRHLFDGWPDGKLELIKSTSFANGVQNLTYKILK